MKTLSDTNVSCLLITMNCHQKDLQKICFMGSNSRKKRKWGQFSHLKMLTAEGCLNTDCHFKALKDLHYDSMDSAQIYFMDFYL